MNAIKTYGNIPKTLLKACERYSDRVDEVGNEGDDGYWVYTRAGFVNAAMDGVSCIHEHTVKDCLWQFAHIIPETEYN